VSFIPGSGTVGPTSGRLGVLVIPPGPGAISFSNSGTSTVYLGAGGTGVTAGNGFALASAASLPPIPLFAGSAGGTVYATTGTGGGAGTVSWILSTSTGQTGP
jgi:hypothetical protein